MTKVRSLPRKCLVLAVAVAMLSAGLASVPASPASAVSTADVSAAPRSGPMTADARQITMGPPADSICLTNADSYCLGMDQPTAEVIVAGIYAAVEIIRIFVGKDSKGDDEDEIKNESDEGSDDDCVQDTGLRPGADADWGPCGANGTVWILVPHNDGAYMYSRYSVDNHNAMVLSADPLSDGAPFYVTIAGNSGSPYWQTFTYYSAYQT